MAEPEQVFMSGFLRKRQRGKHIRRESQRKNLTFQERFCTLTEHYFSYSKKENSKARGSFPAERIKLVTNTDPRAFKRGSLASPDVYFQVGDETEVLYLIAPTKTARDKWKEAFLKVAGERRNKMLERYHLGAYGSKTTGQWSCCNESRKDASGCRSVTTLTRTDSGISQISTKSDDTLKSDNGSLTGSITHSSSCSSGLSKYSSLMEPTLIYREPVNFDDRVTNTSRRSRASTTESGISDMNQHSKAGAKRQQLPSVDSDSDTTDMLSDEFEETEDEGIGRNIRKYQGSTQAEGKKETAHIDLGVSTTVTYPMLIPAFSLTLPQPPNTLLLHQNLLIVGVNGMLQVWDTATANLTLKTSLKIAGQVVSLDSWNNFVAVGSSVVQLIQLKPGADPKRILCAKGKDRLQSPNSRYLVTFLGEDGRLASAKVGGSVIDIWAPPSVDTQVVTKPESSITLDDGSILSLTASSHPTHTWMTAVSKQDGCLKLSTVDWKASNLPFLALETILELNEDHEISACSPHIVNVNGMYIVSGNKRAVSLIDKKTGEIAHSITLAEDVTCMNCAKGVILAGTAGGKVMILSSDNHTIQGQLESGESDQPSSVMAIATETDCRCVYVAHENGLIKAWKAHPSTQHENGQLCKAHECLLGMQLCSEGILIKRQVIPINNHNNLSLAFPDVDAHLQLPEEILDFQNPTIEVAFAPFGPGIGSQFILPNGMIPVSPAVWLCFSPQKKFNTPAKLKLSHCFECENQEDTKHLQFLKAEHDDISRDKSGQIVVTFRPVDKTLSNFLLGTRYCTLEDSHFCIYCLAAYAREEEVIGKINYCLTILKPATYPKDENTRIYCILHPDLEGCRHLVKEQTPVGYTAKEHLLQFNIETERYDSALEIKLDRDHAEACEWMITLQSDNKIHAEDVNFFNYRNIKCLTDACKASPDNHYPYVYPPRFTLEVSSKHAIHPSVLKLAFCGAKRELSTEIPLDWPMSKQDLELRDRERDRGPGGNGYWPSDRTPVHFTSQATNGNLS